MILSIGEILADMIVEKRGGGMAIQAYCGGAPFNCAVNAKQAGAKVGFLGRVGDDPIGRFVGGYAGKAGLDFLEIQKDEERNTTLAFVTLTDGERDFAFYRRDTADYHIELSAVDFDAFTDLKIVHLGSLMLSEAEGRELAAEVAERTKKVGALLSFDVNLRKDIYKNFDEALSAYRPFVEAADIVKFSEDELHEFTGISDTACAVRALNKENALVVVTLGKRGCAYYCKGIGGEIPPAPAEKIVDTTGAGDAFFGALLAGIEGKKFTKENLEAALKRANEAGARTIGFKGAIRI